MGLAVTINVRLCKMLEIGVIMFKIRLSHRCFQSIMLNRVSWSFFKSLRVFYKLIVDLLHTKHLLSYLCRVQNLFICFIYQFNILRSIEY